jgi:hypothetical protein
MTVALDTLAASVLQPDVASDKYTMSINLRLILHNDKVWNKN